MFLTVVALLLIIIAIAYGAWFVDQRASREAVIDRVEFALVRGRVDLAREKFASTPCWTPWVSRPKKALGIRQKLVDANPANTDFLNDLANSRVTTNTSGR